MRRSPEVIEADAVRAIKRATATLRVVLRSVPVEALPLEHAERVAEALGELHAVAGLLSLALPAPAEARAAVPDEPAPRGLRPALRVLPGGRV